jgi:hypothetical protein
MTFLSFLNLKENSFSSALEVVILADDRTRIIINEIKYWKEHKLLPESQCDFLLALYTQGEDYESIASPMKRNYQVNQYVQLILLILMIPFSFLVVYFTQFNFILQLGILVLFLSYAFWVFSYFRKKDIKYIHIAITVFLVLLLITTDFISSVLHLNQYVTILFFIFNFIGWFILSRKLHYKYLMVISFLALFVLLFVNFSHLFSFN